MVLANRERDRVDGCLELVVIEVLALERVRDHDRVILETIRARHQLAGVQAEQVLVHHRLLVLGDVREIHDLDAEGDHGGGVDDDDIVDVVVLVMDQPHPFLHLLVRELGVDEVFLDRVVGNHRLVFLGRGFILSCGHCLDFYALRFDPYKNRLKNKMSTSCCKAPFFKHACCGLIFPLTARAPRLHGGPGALP